MQHWSLIADIGGTNARFASFYTDEITDVKTYPTKSDTSLLETLKTYIKRHNNPPKHIVLAVAGVIKDGNVTLTNAHQSISIEDIRNALDVQNITFINDFEAAAWALVTVSSKDVTLLQGSNEIAIGHRLIIGSGTGLGVGSLIKTSTGYQAVSGEGGHVGITPTSSEELQIFKAFSNIWPETQFSNSSYAFEAEAFLSGKGIPYLYQAVCQVMNQTVIYKTARDILNAAQSNTDIAAIRTVDIFKRQLGKLAGDLALVISAKGGVFITGGVIEQNPWLLDEKFLDGFNNGGRHTKHRKKISVYHYKNTHIGLIGAANLVNSLPLI